MPRATTAEATRLILTDVSSIMVAKVANGARIKNSVISALLRGDILTM